jgi:predicted P-loop ATPase
MVKRLVEPGCKFDFVLVLEGKQGVKKSTSLSILGGDWHVETTMSTDTKDFFMQFAGKSIIEFSEGETMSRTEVKKMKAIITMQYDRFRMPYERTTKDFPRRCVFAMTTNQTEYLKDETGNRRWLPVLVESDHADIEWLAANRDQLFAEAYHRVVTLKETTYELPEKETLAEQQLRRIRDPYADPVAHWYYNILKRGDREQGITVLQVFQQVHCGGSSFGKQMAKWEEMSISGILKDMGLLSRQSTVNKVRASRWYNPNAEVELTETEEIISTLAGNF